MTLKVAENFGVKMKNHTFVDWSQMTVHTSMMNMAGTFGFLGNDFSLGDFKKWDVNIGDEAEVLIEGVPVCNGYLDSIPIEYGGEKLDLQFIGRDKTADLIDCSFDQNNSEFKNQTRANIIQRLCDPFNIEVAVDDSSTEAMNIKIETFRADIGRFVSDVIIELCRDAGVLPISLGDRKLTLTKGTGLEKTTDPIQYNANAVHATLIQDNTNRYSNYAVKGVGTGTDSKQYTDYIQPTGAFEDAVISRYRPLTIFSERATDTGKCRDRAQWEARVRAGFSRGIIYEVPGWMQSDGSIWRINRTTTVYDEVLDISQTMLIAAVTYKVEIEEGNQSAYSLIHVVDEDTFSGSASDIDIKTGFDS